MLDYLVHHAIKNVWCAPFQDFQAILQLKRLTSYGGASVSVEVMWEELPLPNKTDRFHVYMIGQNNPWRLQVSDKTGVWTKLSDACVTNNQIVDLYVNEGVQYARHLAWLYRNIDGNILIAVAMHKHLPDLNRQPLYVRFYTNAYYSSHRQDITSDRIEMGGGIIGTDADIAMYQQQYKDHLKLPGVAYCFHNGYYVSDLLVSRVAKGDVVEWVYDSSVDEIIDFKVDSLPNYISTLDKLKKYLLHPLKWADETETIRYRDDIDIYLYKRSDTGYAKGVYYHRNRENSMRMVTHRDYGLPVPYIMGYVNDNPEWNNTTGLVVRLHVRKSGYQRPLVDEHHRIKELYKLKDEQIIRAMMGIDSTLDEWTVNSLESSSYTHIMRAYCHEVTSDLVVDAYGYNAISKLVADSPLKITGTDMATLSVKLPYELQAQSTIYEYDAKGILLGWYAHENMERYYPRSDQCEMIEGRVGIGTKALDLHKGNAPVQLDPFYGYRFYYATVKNGKQTSAWKETKPGGDHCTLSDKGLLSWTHAGDQFIGCVVSDKTFLAYDYQMEQTTDVYDFSIIYTDKPAITLDIQPEVLDIWMNGRSLVENVDYYVNWPRVTVVTKEYLIDGGPQKFTIRCSGFSDANNTRQPTHDEGWTKHGLLSLNKRYNVRDGKVLRCVADGRVFSVRDLDFAEDHSGLKLPGVDSGRPYQITDVPVPLHGITSYDTLFLRAASQDLDTRLGAYMTSKYPEPQIPGPVAIKEYYVVYSPLIAKILWGLKNKYITMPKHPGSQKEVREAIKDYLYLLEYDPAARGVNDDYVIIEPHPHLHTVTVTQAEYVLLKTVISGWLNNKVDISRHIRVEGL